MARLDGRVALISGGARGLGEATARMFVVEGARVVIGDLLEQEGRALVDELGGTARFEMLDVTRPANWDAAVQAAESAFGPVSVLVNSAGIVKFLTMQDHSDDDYRRVV